MTYVVFDIGGTTTSVALGTEEGGLSDVKRFRTPNNFEEGIKKLIDAARKLGTDKVTGVAGGVRGVLTETHDGIVGDDILTKWGRKPLKKVLEDEFKTKVVLENDAALAGLGEATRGAGKGLEVVAYHTISSGVGGARLVNGKIDTANTGFEPGHQIIDFDRSVLGEDITPLLENFISGTALEKRMGVKPVEIPQEDVVWDELAEYLAYGLRNTIMYWSPDIIILGGSMVLGDPKIPLESIRKHTVGVLDGFVDCPLITTAELKKNSSLYGALELVRNS